MFLLSNLLGCVIRLKEKGEVGFKISNTFAFFHETSKTQSNSEAETDVKPAIDHIIDFRSNDDD